jgi:hypothetical protein
MLKVDLIQDQPDEPARLASLQMAQAAPFDEKVCGTLSKRHALAPAPIRD